MQPLDAPLGRAELPDGLDGWCLAALGSAPVEVLSVSLRISRVFAVRLYDGR